MNNTTKRKDELINSIEQGGAQRERALDAIYLDRLLKGSVIHFVQTNGGNQQDGQDVFQEAIILLDQKIRNKKLKSGVTTNGFIYNAARFLWRNRSKKNAKIDLKENMLPYQINEISNPETMLMDEEKKEFLQSLLDAMGDKCKELLELWQLSYSMEEIAEKMNYSSAKIARKYRYRCHKSLLKLIEKHPHLKRFFN